MTPAAWAELDGLVAEWSLPRSLPTQLRAALGVLADEPAAITTVRSGDAAVRTHILDSLDALAVPVVRGARRIADMGAGAGYPGLALAAALPNASVAMVESAGRKVACIERAIHAAALPNALAVHARVEDWPEGRNRHELVTARAVAPLPVLVEYAAPLLALGGVLVAWKGPLDRSEQDAGDAAAAVVGLERGAIVRQPQRHGAEQHYLHLYSKVSPTPPKFPRRPGMARKRPLGTSTAG